MFVSSPITERGGPLVRVSPHRFRRAIPSVWHGQDGRPIVEIEKRRRHHDSIAFGLDFESIAGLKLESISDLLRDGQLTFGRERCARLSHAPANRVAFRARAHDRSTVPVGVSEVMGDPRSSLRQWWLENGDALSMSDAVYRGTHVKINRTTWVPFVSFTTGPPTASSMSSSCGCSI